MAKNYFNRKIYQLIILILAIPFFSHAEPRYTVAPLVIDEELEARDIVTKQITITNVGTEPVTVYPTVNNISLTEGGAIEEFLSATLSDRTTSLATWIEISRRGIDVRGGETQTVDLTFRINPDPEPGTYHAFVGFGNGRNRDIAEEQVRTGRAPGVVVSITIAEKKLEFLKLSKFIVDRFVTSNANEAAVFTFTNPGDETLVPKGEIILYDNSGKEVGMLPVNNENVAIPPGGEHTFTAMVPTDGLFGKYKAFLSVEYGATQRGSVQDTNFFFIFPLKTLIIITIFIMLLVSLGAWFVHKKYLDDTDVDDSERLVFRIKDTPSEAKEHDVVLKK
jgi:hypothetical protein